MSDAGKLYIVCYDLPATREGEKRRRKVSDTLKDHGDRVQYSVYEGRFRSQEELDKMIAKINRIINLDEDSVRIYPMGRNIEKDIVILGKGEIFDIEQEYIF